LWVLSLTQLESIFETIKIDPSPEIRKELSAWTTHKLAIEAVRPGTSGKGPVDLGIEDIMRYQKVTNYDAAAMDTAEDSSQTWSREQKKWERNHIIVWHGLEKHHDHHSLQM